MASPSLGQTQAAVAREDFRADGVSKREVVLGLVRPTESPSLTFSGLRIKRNLASLGALVAEVPAGSSPESILLTLRHRPDLRFAEPVFSIEVDDQMDQAPTDLTVGPFPNLNWQVQASAARLENFPVLPRDSRINEQHGLEQIGAPVAWGITQGDRGTLLAIIDSGIDLGHEELKDQFVASYNAISGESAVTDPRGHGTHTAGIALASANGVGIVGVAPKAGLLAIQIGSPRKVDLGRSSDAVAAEALSWATDHGAKVISMSWGLYRSSRVLSEALDYALAKDVVLVASAGNRSRRNEAIEAPHLPSTHPGVLEVSAVDAKGDASAFTNFGRTVSVAAPGVGILSAIPGGYKTKSGTSMAAPHVAGVAALIRSQFPGLTRLAVRDRIESTAKDLGAPGFDEYFGNGLLDAAAALRQTSAP